ncbi:V-type proton ATPase subunit C [Trifolium repens]|nr:V-type proton ATPase subunit C [Trifolium repens]
MCGPWLRGEDKLWVQSPQPQKTVAEHILNTPFFVEVKEDSQLNAINRKQTGSLAVRDLSNLKDWLASYETLTIYVVPRSSKKFYEDNEYAVYTVTLFNRVADNFRTSAREKRFPNS